ncbi:MAG TPA: penicillin-binding protein 2 [Thermoleophilaceae bacterium]
MVAVDRRIGALFAVFLVLLLLAGLRSTWLGTVRGHDLKSRAVAQQVEDVTVAARRGTITDRNGVELAVSENSITVFADPRIVKDPGGTASRLSVFLGRPYQELFTKLSDRSKGFVYLARKLPLQKGALVQKLKIPGIGTTEEPRRVYPQGALAGQLLGSVGVDNYGLTGIEQSLEKKLHGKDGKRRIVNDALGKPVSIVDSRRAQAGQDVQLTIDANIQQRVESILAGVGRTFSPKGATALVLDPRDGSILALANWPAHDPSKPGAPSYLTQDRAVQTNYEPGSTFKAFTVAGALEEKLITPNSVFNLPVNLQVADRTITDAEVRGPVTLDVAQILAQSSNVGAVRIGQRLGPKRFDKWVRRFGFGASTGIDLPGEQAGIVLKPSHYSGSSIGNLPIGQGIAVTPIQMATGYEAIADHGVIHRPHVIAGDPAPARRVISRRTATQVSRMLEGVLAAGGTAQEAQVAGYTLAGKTGTAQKAISGGYSKSDFIASFIGFAPARNPRLLVAVMVDTPRGNYYGGVVAAPVFQKIVSFALPYLRIPPG